MIPRSHVECDPDSMAVRVLSYQMLAAPPWHWWIAVNLLILDGILLIGLGILYYKMVVAPARSMRRDPAVANPSHEGVLETKSDRERR